MSDSSGSGWLGKASDWLGRVAKVIGYAFLISLGVVLATNLVVIQGGDLLVERDDELNSGRSNDGLVLVSDTVSYTLNGPAIIEGIVKNTSDQTYSYVEVKITVYESDSKTHIGTTMANTNDLQPGTRWRFEALAPREVYGGISYEITEITAR